MTLDSENDPRAQTLCQLERLVRELRRCEALWSPGAEHPSVLNEPIRSVVGQTWKDGLTPELDQALTRAHEYPQAVLREIICVVEWFLGACESALDAAQHSAGGAEELGVILHRTLGDGDKTAAAVLAKRRQRVLVAMRAVQSSLGVFGGGWDEDEAELSDADVEMCEFCAGIWSEIVAAGDEYLKLQALLDAAVRAARAGAWPARDIAPSLERLREMIASRIAVLLEECRFNARALRAMGDPEATAEARHLRYQSLRQRNKSRMDYVLI